MEQVYDREKLRRGETEDDPLKAAQITLICRDIARVPLLNGTYGVRWPSRCGLDDEPNRGHIAT